MAYRGLLHPQEVWFPPEAVAEGKGETPYIPGMGTEHGYLEAWNGVGHVGLWIPPPLQGATPAGLSPPLRTYCDLVPITDLVRGNYLHINVSYTKTFKIDKQQIEVKHNLFFDEVNVWPHERKIFLSGNNLRLVYFIPNSSQSNKADFWVR